MNNQQKITGVVLNNSEIGLPRKWIKNYRAAIHNANNLLRTSKEIPKEKKYEIAGMTSWVRSVNSKRYQKLIEAANEAGDYYSELLLKEFKKDKVKMLDEGAVYVEISTKEFSEKSRKVSKQFEEEGFFSKGLYDYIQELR